jgi:hypothetical protein
MLDVHISSIATFSPRDAASRWVRVGALVPRRVANRAIQARTWRSRFCIDEL